MYIRKACTISINFPSNLRNLEQSCTFVSTDDLKGEKMGLEPITIVVGEPTHSFTNDPKRRLYEQFCKPHEEKGKKKVKCSSMGQELQGNTRHLTLARAAPPLLTPYIL